MIFPLLSRKNCFVIGETFCLFLVSVSAVLNRVPSKIPKLKIPTGQNPETQNPEIQNPDRFKIPTGTKSRQVKIPTGQNPDISLAAKFQYTCVTQSVLYLFIHNIFAPTLSTTLSTIKTL